MAFLLNRPRYVVLGFYALLFVILSFTALAFVYVEGDDASTIIYHLFGRNAAIQAPFSSYHSGFDFLLSFLPRNESVLRTASFLLSFISGFLILFLLSLSLFQIFKNEHKKVMFFSLLLPFIIPEFLFSGLIINPTNVGFVFCLLALLFTQLYFSKRQKIYLWVIPIMLLIGVPFRWSLIVFIPVLFGFWIFSKNKEPFSWVIIKADFGFLVSLFFSVVLSFIGIWITGYNPKEVLEVMIWGAGYSSMAANGISLSLLAANGMALFTPSMIILTAAGIILILKKKEYSFFAFVFLSVLPFFFLGLDTSFKYLITLIPALVLVVYNGFSLIYSKKSWLIGICILIVLPWLFGAELSTKGVDYGPRFEISNWQSASNPTKKPVDGKMENPDNRLKISNVKAISSGGFAMPTVEGPRPIYGYFWVFFGQDWKRFLTAIEDERSYVLNELSKKQESILLQEKPFSSFECLLFSHGFACVKIMDVKGSHDERTYQKADQRIKIIVPKRSENHEEMCVNFSSFKPDLVYTFGTSNAQSIAYCAAFNRIAPFTLIPSNSSSK